MKAPIKPFLSALLLLAFPAAVHAQFTFTTNNGNITITSYTGSEPDVVVPDATNGYPVTTIGGYAFFSQRGIVTNITIGSNVTNIATRGFYQCSKLKGVTMNSQISSIGQEAFLNCTSLISISIPNSVTNIGRDAFNGCTSLPTISIPNGVISPWAFELCAGLTNATIGSGVTSIGSNAFWSCTSLAAITVDSLNLAYSSLDGVLFDSGQKRLIAYPGGKGGDYAIPSTVTSIAAFAFDYCTNLTGIAIPNSVTNIGDYAFDACRSLAIVRIPDSARTVGYAAFQGCHSLTNLTISGSVRTLRSLAFSWCDSLPTVTIPMSVTNMEPQAFSYCKALTSVYFQGNAPTLGSSGLGSTPFLGVNASAVVYYLPETSVWATPFGGLPAVLWNPTVQTTDGSFGVQNNQFGFNIVGTPDIPIAVAACTNPASPNWTALKTCTLTNGSIYFTDPDWTNHPTRFYRIRSP